MVASSKAQASEKSDLIPELPGMEWARKVISSGWMTMAVIVVSALTSMVVISEADTLWQTRLGLDMLAGGSIVAPDKYSWVAEGTEYLSNSWLWSVLLGWAYTIGAEYGLLAVSGIGVGLTITLLALTLRKLRLSWYAISLALLIAILPMKVWLNARPQLADYILTALFMLILAATRTKKAGFALVMVAGPAIIMLWNNLHLTGLVGALLFAGMAFVAFPGSWWARTLRGFTLAVLSVTACLVTPYGLEGLAKPLTTANSSMGMVSEWLSPFSLYGTSQYLGLVAIAVFVVVCIWLFRSRRWYEALFLCGLIGVASWQSRWLPFMAFVGVVWLAQFIVAHRHHVKGSVERATILVVASVMIPLFSLSALALIPKSGTEIAEYGVEVVMQVPHGCKLANVNESGGPMLLYRPDVKVSMDGRNDMYGVDEYITQNHVMFGAREDFTRKWLNENDITCILANDSTTIADHILGADGWSIVDDDGYMKLLIRDRKDIPLGHTNDIE